MQSNDNIRINLPDRFLRSNTVLFVDSPVGEAGNFIKEYSTDLIKRFKEINFTFTYLPNLINQLSPEVLQFMFPGQKDILSTEDLYLRIQNIAGLNNKSGFLYNVWGDIYFKTLPEKSQDDIKNTINQFINSLQNLEKPFDTGIRFCKKINFDFDFDFDFTGKIKDEPLDPRALAIIDAWEKIEKEFGVTLEDVELLLGYKVKLSRLHITTAGNIILTDYEGKEVKMNDLSKAVYFYYLRHPEGASLKELQLHEEEILKYYMGITGRDNIEDIRKSIHNLLDPYRNDLNISISRIKKAFKDIVGDRIAKFYYVTGKYAGLRKISLDRDYVIWDH